MSKHPRPWHAGSIFGPGYRRPLAREQRARFKFLVAAHHRAGRITRLAMAVAEALLRRLGVDGQCDPAHETIAHDVACCARSVRRATVTLRALGLIHWQQRLIRDGSYVEQTSNQYALSIASAMPFVDPMRLGDGQSGRQIQSVLNLEELVVAQAALARRRDTILARFSGALGVKEVCIEQRNGLARSVP